MRLLSLYGVVAVTLLVCCLAPGDALGKPVKERREGRPLAGREDHGREGHGMGQGRGRPEAQDENSSSSTSSPSSVASGDNKDGDFSSSGRGDGGDGAESAKPDHRAGDHGRGHHHHHHNSDSSIRPQYNKTKPAKGPVGLGEDGANRKKRNMHKAMGYMSKYGYMADDMDDDWETNVASMEKVRKGIRMAQRFMGLKETGELDEMTVMMMDKPRCGVRDMASPVAAVVGEDGAPVGPLPYQHFGQKWDQTEITFRILNYPSAMPSSETREALLRAFRVWSDVTPLTFREVGRTVPEAADFYIKFGARSHGDNFPFDGRGGVLAHAFLPKTNSGDLEGDVHFDDEELFTYASYAGTNLFQVAAHEIGHSLGLSHSSNPTALMAPFYPGYQAIFSLPYDDLAGIQSLYGSNPNNYPYPNPYPNPPSATTTASPADPTTVTTTTTATTTTATTTTSTVSTPSPEPVDPCSPVIDAITTWRGEFFAFTGSKYGRIRDYKILSRIGGSEAGYFFQNFPVDIDAIYETPTTYKLLMFKGPSYYVYEGLTLESGPNPITDLDPALPGDLDAVVTWAADRKTYFFKGELVWQYDEVTRRVDSGWPYRIDQVWFGLPNKVTGAWHDEERHLTYFLSGKGYFRYDDSYAEVDVGYPRDFIADFFGCF